MANATTATNAPPATRLLGTGLGVAAALGADTLAFVLGDRGTPTMVITGWAPEGTELSFAEVAVTATVAVTAGGLLLALVERRRRRSWLAPWSALAGAVAVASALPLWRLAVDTGSRVALTAMHLLTGAAAIAGHHVATGYRVRSVGSSPSCTDSESSPTR